MKFNYNPRVKVTLKLVKNLTKEEVLACKKVAFFECSHLKDSLDICLKRFNSGSFVVVAKDYKDRVISWALCDKTSEHDTVQIFTRRACRRNGYGKLVINKVKERLGRNEFVYFPYDEKSRAFYKATECENKRKLPFFHHEDLLQVA
jgi:Acetyltransferase (GNAT) family